MTLARLAAVGGLVLGDATPGAAAPIFQGLGILSGGVESRALGVSANGTIVVGSSGTVGVSSEAFRWTAAGGMVSIGGLPHAGQDDRATDASASGDGVVGTGRNLCCAEGFRWTAGSGMQPIGGLPGGGPTSSVEGVSDDGSVLVGWSLYSPVPGPIFVTEAFRYSLAGEEPAK